MTALKKALPVGVVRYGCGVKAVDEVGGREGLGVKVSLDGGDLVEGDVLVVADGIFSRFAFITTSSMSNMRLYICISSASLFFMRTRLVSQDLRMICAGVLLPAVCDPIPRP